MVRFAGAIQKRSHWHLGEILIQKAWINWDQLARALDTQGASRQPLGEILIECRAISRQCLYRALAIQYHLPFVSLEGLTIHPEAIRRVPRWLVVTHKIMPVDVGQKSLLVATANPANLWMKALLQEQTGIQDILFTLACPHDILQAITSHYGASVDRVGWLENLRLP